MTQTQININELKQDILDIKSRLETEDNPYRIEKLQYDIKILNSLIKNQ